VHTLVLLLLPLAKLPQLLPALSLLLLPAVPASVMLPLLLWLLSVRSLQWLLLPKVMTRLSTLSAAGTIMLNTKQLAARQRLQGRKHQPQKHTISQSSSRSSSSSGREVAAACESRTPQQHQT
jgi:hypothetical protein